MREKLYEIYIDEKLQASYLSIETAIILVKALFEEYNKDYTLKITIQKMQPPETSAVVNEVPKGIKCYSHS